MSNFTQREYNVDTPRTGSTTSSSIQGQQQQAMYPLYAANPEASTSKTSFSMASLFATKGSIEKNAKQPKRRGPKRDANPPKDRRAELNRVAQRTHRDRKELYTKNLETQIVSVKEQLYKTVKEKEAIESENQFLKKLLEANGIPYPPQFSPSNTTSLPTPNSAGPAPSTYSSTYAGSPTYFPPPNFSLPSNNVANNGLSPTKNPYSVTPTPSFSPANSSELVHMNNTYTGVAQTDGNLQAFDFSAYQKPYSDSGLDQVPLDWQMGAIQNRNAPLFDRIGIRFVVTLESACSGHAGYKINLGETNPDELSGHETMLTTHNHNIIDPTAPYDHQLPDVSLSMVNTMLQWGNELNLDGQLSAVAALQVIRTHDYHPAMTLGEFVDVQQYLFTKFSCFGFGAVVEDFYVRQAMDNVAAKYAAAANVKWEGDVASTWSGSAGNGYAQ